MVPEAFSQWFNSILHLALSLIIWEVVFTAYQIEFGDRVAEATWQGSQKNPELLGTFVHWAGIIGFFTFLFTLKGLFVWTYLLDSLVRLASMAAIRKHNASIFLFAPLWLLDHAKRAYSDARTIEKYGSAYEPDRLFETKEGFCVRSTRSHEEWHAQMTFRYKGSLYRLDSETEVQEGKRHCHECRFSPWPENWIIRRVVVLGEEE